VSTVTWNVLLSLPPAAYFTKRLTNEGKLKRACEFQDKFLYVLAFFRSFLRVKSGFNSRGGSTRFRALKGDSMEFGRN
jgi:hypothetical protein